jgi:HK97 gp10 family phage protein
MSRGRNTIAFGVDLSGLNAQLDRLGDAAEAAARPAAQAVAQVYYEAARSFAPRSKKGHWFHGTSFKINGKKYWFDAGTLTASIYQVYSQDHSGKGVAQYHVSWNHKKAPYGSMVEFGTSKAPAHSFIRRAAADGGVAGRALAAGEKLLMDKIAEAAR